jgi:aromatase
MVEVVHEVLINCEPESAFRVGTEVEKWPDIFPPCHATKVLEKSDSHIVFEITADTEEGKVNSWVSRREIASADLKISFKQTKVVSPLRSMEGEWRFEKAGDQTKVSLIHKYEANAEHLDLVARILDRNSRAELQSIKEYLEK